MNWPTICHSSEYAVMHNTIIRTEQFSIFCRTFNNLVGNRNFFSQQTLITLHPLPNWQHRKIMSVLQFLLSTWSSVDYLTHKHFLRKRDLKIFGTYNWTLLLADMNMLRVSGTAFSSEVISLDSDKTKKERKKDTKTWAALWENCKTNLYKTESSSAKKYGLQ